MPCCGGLFIPEFCKDIESVIDNLNLDESQKIILKNRYVKVVNFYQRKAASSGQLYNIFRTLVTTGSLFIPALLSVQQIGTEALKNVIYWATWGLSLGVTTANGYIQLFKIDRYYYAYSMVAEKLKSEGWLYFQLSGKYENSTHKKSFNSFCEKIEIIKMKQVNSDFSELGNKKIKKKSGLNKNLIENVEDPNKLMSVVGNVNENNNLQNNILEKSADILQNNLQNNILEKSTDLLQNNILEKSTDLLNTNFTQIIPNQDYNDKK